MIKPVKIVLVLLLFPIGMFSQNEKDPLSKKEIRKETRKDIPSYIGISFGLGSSSFRDFATSPLFYKGTPRQFSLSHTKQNGKKEYEKGFTYSSGSYSNKFNDHESSSAVKTVSLFYSRLYELKRLSTEKLNVKVGGLFNTTGNLRINYSLQNNAVGLELFPTLFASVKLTRDISRKETKQKKFLFIKYKLKKKNRDLAFNLNGGVLNGSLRNGYAYISQSSVLNSLNIFDNYEFNFSSGFRMSSALDYTISLKNKNKVQISYLWDAYKTGGDLDQFSMIRKTLKISLLFNTNNK